jgi:hypothetical protein
LVSNLQAHALLLALLQHKVQIMFVGLGICHCSICLRRYALMYGSSPFQQALDQGASLALAVIK